MIILDKVCTDSKTCTQELMLQYPNIRSINHFPNEHVINFENDYDIQGSPKKSEFDKVVFTKSKKLTEIASKEFSKL